MSQEHNKQQTEIAARRQVAVAELLLQDVRTLSDACCAAGLHWHEEHLGAAEYDLGNAVSSLRQCAGIPTERVE